MNETWILLGATSSMARAFGRAVAERGATVYLAGRDMEDLKGAAVDLEARGAPKARAVKFDARDPSTFGPIIAAAEGEEGLINAAVFVGSMPEQSAIESDCDRVFSANTGTSCRLARRKLSRQLCM